MAHPMAGRYVRSVFFRVGLVLAVPIAGCTSAPAATPTPPPTPAPPPVAIAITIDGLTHQVIPSTTLGRLQRDFHLKPEAGRLLSLSGATLEPKEDPGRLLLNGFEAERRTTLAAGDAIVVVSGQDRTEGTKKVEKILKGKRPADPQFSLRTWPMKEIDTVGRVSGDLGSVLYRPIGRVKVPGKVALTFDDGPWPTYTRKVVKVLRHHHVRATFFMIGENVERWPGIARAVVKAGMAVGNHSWDHVQKPVFAKIRPHRLETEVSKTNEALERLGVKRPYLFRPPGGSFDDRVVQEARRHGLRVVNWNVDPQDWRSSRSAKEIAHAVLSHVRPGSIVDMHDGGGDQSATVKALPMIIRGIRKMGLKLVAIPR